MIIFIISKVTINFYHIWNDYRNIIVSRLRLSVGAYTELWKRFIAPKIEQNDRRLRPKILAFQQNDFWVNHILPFQQRDILTWLPQ